jgi:hypothetical protein
MIPGAENDKLIDEGHQLARLCPNGSLSIVNTAEGMSVKDVATGKVIRKTKSPSFSFLGWSPDSKMFLCRSSRSIEDEDKLRKSDLNTLWLMSLEPHEANSMCIALDSQIDDYRPTWSADGMKIAYMSQGRLCVAELFKRPATAWEKMTSGVALNEDEDRQIMELNADIIKMALQEYTGIYDNVKDGKLPPKETALNDLRKHLNETDGKTVFNRPGTGELIFTYSGDSSVTTGVAPPVEIGELDAGYDWKIVFYSSTSWKLVIK